MIRLGLIGAGPNGTGNIRNLLKHGDRCRLTAVADPVTEAAERVAAEFGADHVVADCSECFDHVDAVVISSPNWLHPDHAVACAGAGKHVWIEKPMALTTAEADRICAACDAAGVKSFVGFSVRFGGGPRTITQRYRQGELGELRSIFSQRSSNLFKHGITGWRADFSRSGGVMAELLAHEIDWMVDAVGDPDSVYCRIASRRNADPRDNDHVWLTFGFGDATGTIEGAQDVLAAEYHKGIIGEAGSCTDRQWGGVVHLHDGDGDRQIDLLPAFDKHGHFLDVIEGRCESVADCHHGRKIVHLSEQALDSAVSGQVVPLTPSPATTSA